MPMTHFAVQLLSDAATQPEKGNSTDFHLCSSFSPSAKIETSNDLFHTNSSALRDSVVVSKRGKGKLKGFVLIKSHISCMESCVSDICIGGSPPSHQSRRIQSTPSHLSKGIDYEISDRNQ